jgi:hypothetical protein
MELVRRLRQANMVASTVAPPEAWRQLAQVPAHDVAAFVQQHLTRDGWHRVLQAKRHPGQPAAGTRLDLSNPTDFLDAVELALRPPVVATPEAPLAAASTDVLDEFVADRLPHMGRHLQGQVESLADAWWQPAESGGWFASPRGLWLRLSRGLRRTPAEAQVEAALREAALYSARTMGADAERDRTLARVDRLRAELRRQLKVFCEEEGLPLPKPYSREEAYALHLLTPYFVSLAEAERAIARRGSALARRQIALEGERTEARINHQLLPELLDTLYRVDPLREGFLREQIRHRSALIVSGVVAGVGGTLWGLVEGSLDVLTEGLSRYAPVLAPPLLVGVATLVAQTVAYGVPASGGLLAGFVALAAWNTLLTLIVTATIYGSWQYLAGRRPKATGAARTRTERKDHQGHGMEGTGAATGGSLVVGDVLGSQPGNGHPHAHAESGSADGQA